MRSWKPLLRYALIALFVLMVSVAAVPAARAQAGDVFNKVVDIIFVGSGPLPTGPDAPTIISLENGKPNPEEVMALTEAQQQLSFTPMLPTWSPDGYVLNENEAAVMSAEEQVIGLHVKWNNGENQIDLYAVKFEGEPTLPDIEGAQKVEVNGVPALLTTTSISVYIPQSQTDTQGSGTVIVGDAAVNGLQWIQDGISYNLNGAIPAEDLLRMAESMQ